MFEFAVTDSLGAEPALLYCSLGFNVSILLLLLFEHSVCAVYFTCICFNFLFLRFAELNAPEETGKETDFVLI